MPTPIHTIITHLRPHFDEVLAIFLLRRNGEPDFPGVRKAKLQFWSAGSPPPDGRSAEEWERDGYLLVGVGHGRFDEHATPDRPRQEGHSATSLVAEAIHISRRGYLKALIDYATKQDLEGGGTPYELANLTKALNAQNPINPERVIHLLEPIIRAVVDQAMLMAKALELMRPARKVELGQTPDGLIANLVIIESDNEAVLGAAFSQRGGRAAVLICRKTSGNVQVFTNKFFMVEGLDELAKALRQAELGIMDPSMMLEDEVLTREGTLPEVPQWHYFKPAAMLLNGSLTSPGTPATSLSLDEIEALVIAHIRIPQPTEPAPEP